VHIAEFTPLMSLNTSEDRPKEAKIGRNRGLRHDSRIFVNFVTATKDVQL